MAEGARAGGENYHDLKRLARSLGLHTVCESAHCPNIGECWQHKTATFMMLGNLCTRRCGFCAVPKGRPEAIDFDEPRRVAEAVATLGLQHAVITSVNRDDDLVGGARAFAMVIDEIRRQAPGCRVEVLIPDFQGNPRRFASSWMRARGAQSQHRVRAAALSRGPLRGAL
jgi:lipoic acid synthetase